MKGTLSVGTFPITPVDPADDRVALVDVTFPMLVPSVANLREHWRVGRRRVQSQRVAAQAHVMAACSREPGRHPVDQPSLRILITRIAPRPIKDEHDNLRSSLKAIVDGAALALGVDDADPRLTWEYAQRRTARDKEHRELPSVRVQIWRR